MCVCGGQGGSEWTGISEPLACGDCQGSKGMEKSAARTERTGAQCHLEAGEKGRTQPGSLGANHGGGRRLWGPGKVCFQG